MGPLRILIQHRDSKQFLKSRRTWTSNQQSARSFPTALSAFYFAAEAELHNVEIVWTRTGVKVEKDITEREMNAPSRSEIRRHAFASVAAR